MPTKDDLRIYQHQPLYLKVMMTKQRIREWIDFYGTDGVYVSFSGGKDSTVLLHIVREEYPDVPAVFVNTGLEYPEIQSFVKTFENVEILRPKMRFDEVIKKYGYPVISKRISDYAETARQNPNSIRAKYLNGTKESLFCSNGKYADIINLDFKVSAKCCNVMKKKPISEYIKHGKAPMTGQMACESVQRESTWLMNGCNAFNSVHPISNPMSFWTEQDVLQYIKEHNLPIASVYGDIVAVDELGNQYNTPLLDNGLKLKTTGCHRTGCIFCAFGAHCRGDTRFVDLNQTHPKQYAYCIGGGEFNDDGVWQPSKDGLGMGYVFDRLNEIYGENFIKYK